MNDIEVEARQANSPDVWDKLWSEEGQDTWRKDAMAAVYSRIEELIPLESNIVDIGGGIGILAKRLKDNRKCTAVVWDISPAAVTMAIESGTEGMIVDLESYVPDVYRGYTIVCTEVVEHLSKETREKILNLSKDHLMFISVPNDRLSHEEEHQHTITYTAKSFLDELRFFCPTARVEVYGPYLLGVCGVAKSFTMSVTMPLRDEADDIERVLASFRGVADEMIIGVDPRTIDNTFEIALKYADQVFYLENPSGPPDDNKGEDGVHFSWVRNQCIDKCTSDWIFMTEGHERLLSGQDTLLNLKSIVPEEVRACLVLRTGAGQQWAFPWLFRNAPDLRFKRSTHNLLDMPDGTFVVRLPQVRTMHERSNKRTTSRAEQRKSQNRLDLMKDWVLKDNDNSLFYLGQEWREYDSTRAEQYLEQYLLRPSRNGVQRYQARLMLAKLYAADKNPVKARAALIRAVEDDWSRTEHYLWLGDLAWNEDKFEEALQFWNLAGTTCGNPPFTLWWIDISAYTYVPAQRLAMCYSHLGRYSEALLWARKVKLLLPDDAPAEVVAEAENNIKILEEVVSDV